MGATISERHRRGIRSGTLGQVRRGRLRQRDRQPRRSISTFLSPTAALLTTIARLLRRSEEVGQMRLDGEAWVEGIEGGVGRDLGGIVRWKAMNQDILLSL